MRGKWRLFLDANIPLSLIFEQQPFYPKCMKFREDVIKTGESCFIVDTVSSEIDETFNLAISCGGNSLRRLIVHLSAQKGVVARAFVNMTNIEPRDRTIIESFFDVEIKKAGSNIKRDLVRHSETWVITKLDELLEKKEEIPLIQFLVELSEENTKHYIKWKNRKLKILCEMNCQQDHTKPRKEDLELVEKIGLPDKVKNKDRRILATLHRIKSNGKYHPILVSTDYGLVSSRKKVSEFLGITVSDPLYAISKMN